MNDESFQASVTYPKTITVNFIFHCFFSSWERSRYLSSFSYCFNSNVGSDGAVLYLTSTFPLVKVWSSGQDCWIPFFFSKSRSLFILKSQRSLCISFLKTDFYLFIYDLSVWQKFSRLHNYLRVAFSTQLCLLSYSFFDSLLHSLVVC